MNNTYKDEQPKGKTCETMSVCLETSNVLASSVGTSSVSSQLLQDNSSNSQTVVSSISSSQSSISTNVIQTPLSANIVQISNEKPEQQVTAFDIPNPLTKDRHNN